MKKIKYILTVIFMLLGLNITAQAELRIDVTGSQSEPLPFAMQNLFNPDGSQSAFGKDITEVVIADLERSGLFRYINPAAYIQKMKGVDMRPNFNDWQAINAQVLIYGEVQESMGKTSVSFRVFDVFAQ